jgi:hypothetical protein
LQKITISLHWIPHNFKSDRHTYNSSVSYKPNEKTLFSYPKHITRLRLTMQLVSVVLFTLAIEAVGSFSVCPTLKSYATINHLALSMQETGDPRIDEADSTFKAIMGGVGAAFGGLAKAKNARATHTFGSTGRGRLTVL